MAQNRFRPRGEACQQLKPAMAWPLLLLQAYVARPEAFVKPLVQRDVNATIRVIDIEPIRAGVWIIALLSTPLFQRLESGREVDLVSEANQYRMGISGQVL